MSGGSVFRLERFRRRQTYPVRDYPPPAGLYPE
jgi:hypothetical protein